MNYNLGAAYLLGLHKKSEHGWQVLRDAIAPMQGDLLAQHVEQPPAATERPQPRQAVPQPQPQPAASPPAVQTSAPHVLETGTISIAGMARFQRAIPAERRERNRR